MTRIIDTEMKGPSIRDVMIWGLNVFPNAMWWSVDYPTLSANESIEIVEWCIAKIGNNDYYYSKGTWYFTYENDATLFKLTWC
jgi:hypothetical protein